LGKLLLTPLCLAAGFPGGVFAPTLVVGAALGGVFGHLWTAVFPGHSPGVAILVLIGMATLLASTMHAPLTALMLTFELTSDDQLLLPVLLAVAVGYLVSLGCGGASIYTRNLERAGIRLVEGLDVDLLETITVAEVMSADTIALEPGDSLETAYALLKCSQRSGLPVVDKARTPIGMLTHTDLEIELAHAGGFLRVADACSLDPVTIRSDATIGAALQKMAPRGLHRMPVVSGEMPPVLVGMLSSEQISNAYQLALARRRGEGAAPENA
jgi:CIC family chloride channel protein